MPQSFYFISDLHLGGEGPQGYCEFEEELILFLKKLEKEKGPAELIIVGDLFGLWEMTEAKRGKRVAAITRKLKKLFNQLKKTGEKIKITLIPGNHDHDLACFPEERKTLEKYKIHVEPAPSITRKIGDKTIWIEHGHEHDPINRISDFGNPHATPIGYFVASEIISAAARHSILGRRKWLHDIGCVRPNEHVPDWIFSNYFYHEMSPVLRWILLPFLLLFGVSLIVVAGIHAEKWGILKSHFFTETLTRSLWVFGDMLDAIFFVNGIVILFLLVIAIPTFFILRDLKRILKRYDIKTDRLRSHERRHYLEAARKRFQKNPNVGLFIFGHTHDAFVQPIGKRLVLNTGSWLKIVRRIPARFRLVPDVYIPYYQLGYFKISALKNKIRLDYSEIPKKARRGLTLLQRFVIFLRRQKNKTNIPKTLAF